jgi:hypothetical protein
MVRWTFIGSFLAIGVFSVFLQATPAPAEFAPNQTFRMGMPVIEAGSAILVEPTPTATPTPDPEDETPPGAPTHVEAFRFTDPSRTNRVLKKLV